MLPNYLFGAYKATNEMSLSKIPSLAGAHKSQEALETVPLGIFLMKLFSEDGLSDVEFCLKTSDMPGLARLAANNMSVALENLAIIIELGDIEILSTSGLLRNHSEEVLNHLMRCYPTNGDTPAPISWSKFATRLLEDAGPAVTRRMLLRASSEGFLRKGELSAQFYRTMIIKKLLDTKPQM